MIIHVDHMTDAEVNRINIQRAYDMLGIDQKFIEKIEAERKRIEAEEAEKARKADALKRARFELAVYKLKQIRKDITNGKTDVKVGSKIAIDGFVFVV